MALIDTYGFKFNPDIPYMTRAEMALFKRLRAGGRVSFFKCGTCECCGVELLKGKRYCSERCFKITESENGQENKR